jgi:hypothetical protein
LKRRQIGRWWLLRSGRWVAVHPVGRCVARIWSVTSCGRVLRAVWRLAARAVDGWESDRGSHGTSGRLVRPLRIGTGRGLVLRWMLALGLPWVA